MLISLLLCAQCLGCELLVKAVDYTHSDATEDRRGAYKRGMVVVVKPDGWSWGTEERLPKFVVIKIPGIAVSKAEKYIAQQFSAGEVYRRRLWQVRWADLPAAARTKLATGRLTIKATDAYTGAYDYTWDQIKTYFRNLETNTDETQSL